ncbi:methyltransferase [uncultured Alistipes sp.]|uniref:methyltransferase n=1 Tax=uncultured Alistipes sp. TaxID=538949 RepID=UPI002593CEB4|nr:methyltransferase [uncultured Alistipes sp.]
MLLGERLKKQGGRLSRFRGVLPLVVRALLVSLVGLAVRVRTAGHTPDRTSDRRTAEGQVADEPNTTGIYSVMRNPLYVGDLFKWPGIALLPIFSLLDCAGEWIGGKEPKYGWLLAAASLCAVGYAVLKYLKHRTTRLDGSPA